MTVATTIFALSSGSPPAAIGVVRLSGPGAGAALVAVAGALPAPRHAVLRWFHDPTSGETLDRGLALWFPGPRTATGEDLAELHIHGGRAVAAAVLAALGRIEGLRLAEPGEFTRRAFINGAIDLAEAEGLADLLAAETESQRRAALANAGGMLSRQIERWRDEVLGAAAMVEAMLDFSDEGDVALDEAPVRAILARLVGEMRALLARPPAERLRDGVRVVLAGPPNSGKSTLLNALVGRDAAIVSPIAGTTRDVIEAPVAIGGVALLLSDTAGLHHSDDPIESIGIARATEAIAGADVVIWLGAAKDCPVDARALLVHARCDIDPAVPVASDVAVSAVTGEGIERLVTLLLSRARLLMPHESETTANMRQRSMILACVASLELAWREPDCLIAAEGLRRARQSLDKILGRSGVEDMLDALFRKFCIGK